jgi:putative endonuclease
MLELSRQNRRSVGEKNEELAVRFLEKKGYQILVRNYRTPVGEIDIVGKQGDCLCFVEVRSRRSEKFGSPAESINFRKRQHLIRTAQWYLQSKRWDGEARFDVVSIIGSGSEANIEWIPNAFEVEESV